MTQPRMPSTPVPAGIAATQARNLDAAVVAVRQFVVEAVEQAVAVAPDKMVRGVQARSGVEDFWIGGECVGEEARAGMEDRGRAEHRNMLHGTCTMVNTGKVPKYFTVH